MNSRNIEKICVIGAGTMGSGIAAHFANLGFQVTLLDATASSVRAAFDRAKTVKPPHFYTPQASERITLGSTEQNLDWVATADWVIEVIVEKLDAKRSLYARLEPLLGPETFISTNTSGLEISMLCEGRSADFRRRFVGTHFFNPPRYLKLLELIPTNESDPSVVKALTEFLETHAARRVIVAKDTPGFIANRFGMWAMFQAVHAAERLGLPIEVVDAITGPFLGRPRSGSFRLNDLVGLDIMADIAQNLIDRCPNDPMIETLKQPKSLSWLLGQGWIGEKAKQGYYRKEGKEFLSFDLNTHAYRDRLEPNLATLTELSRVPLVQRVQQALHRRDEVGEFLRAYLVPTLHYAESIAQEISHNVLDFDRVMQWGFGWELGPFALMDAIGDGTKLYYPGQEVLQFDGTHKPCPSEPEFRQLADYPVVDKQETYTLRDLGDGVHAAGITTKMGVITPQLVTDLTALVKSGKVEHLVLASEAKTFSVGFDLKYFAKCLDEGDYDSIDKALTELQVLGELLQSMPSCSAVFGYCLGAGLELAFSCRTLVASAESQIGLPEIKVGLVPAGRGASLMRLNNQASGNRLVDAFSTMVQGTISASADNARQLCYLRPHDVTCYHPDRLITMAKEAVLKPTEPRNEWAAEKAQLSGMIDQEITRLRSADLITEYDVTIAHCIKSIFAKSTSYEEAVMAERWHFLELCHHSHSAARIRHMVETNKPLRN